MKNKIAIMTQPLGLNYGGIIQNYALQKVLKDKGLQPVTVSRVGENPHSKIKILANKFKTLLFRHVLQPKNPIYFDINKIAENNDLFLNGNVYRSPKISSTQQLENYFKDEKFTAVVVGSDQVWRPKYSPNIYNFFLDFIRENNSIKKVAYAASFGTEDWEYTTEQTQNCIQLIEKFDAVSVREDSGVQLCSKYLDRKDAVHVLDPTLLLSAEEYSSLINQPKKDIGMFTYVLDETEDKLSFINKCAEDLGLHISRNQAKFSNKSLSGSRIEDYIIPPIEGWLQGFRDADFVITDSFHGTVFSILNQKPFLSLVNKSRGASRFESLLKKIGLQDRLIYDINDVKELNLKKEIDYASVLLKLNELKADSISFIDNQFHTNEGISNNTSL